MYYDSEISLIIDAINKSDNDGNHFFIWPKSISSTIKNILSSSGIIVVPNNSTSDKYFEMKDSGKLIFTDENTTIFAHKEKHEKYEKDWSNASDDIKFKYNSYIIDRRNKKT
jgi:hypothetical protein